MALKDRKANNPKVQQILDQEQAQKEKEKAKKSVQKIVRLTEAKNDALMEYLHQNGRQKFQSVIECFIDDLLDWDEEKKEARKLNL